MIAADRHTNTCCFLGQRDTCATEELNTELYEIIEDLIVDKKVTVFQFGSKSAFNHICYQTVTKIKRKYPHILRIYVRAEFPDISDSYRAYLLSKYEDTYFPKSILGAGKAIYIKRNKLMIDNSDFCVFYYEEGYAPQGRKSGTEIALTYAKKRQKNIYVLPSISCHKERPPVK